MFTKLKILVLVVSCSVCLVVVYATGYQDGQKAAYDEVGDQLAEMVENAVELAEKAQKKVDSYSPEKEEE